MNLILFFVAESEVYIEQKKYDEAFGILVKQIELGKEANFAWILINYYKTLVSSSKFEKAKRIKEEFFVILKNKLRATPKDCELAADRSKDNRDFMKAILLYQAAEALYNSNRDSDEIVNCLQGCALGLKIAAGDLLKERPDLRSIVADDVVPAMRRIYDKLSNMFSAHTHKMVLIRSLCLHHIETTELIAEENLVRERSLREAIDLMDKAFGDEAGKYHLYSSHLNNLAVVCMVKEEIEEAIATFEKAIESRKTATDYSSEPERNRDIEASKSGLEKSKEMLRYMKTS